MSISSKLVIFRAIRITRRAARLAARRSAHRRDSPIDHDTAQMIRLAVAIATRRSG